MKTNTKKSPTDFFESFVKAVKVWIDPNGAFQTERLENLSVDPVALKITYAEPAPDGDFEILFVSREKSEDKKRQLFEEGDKIEIISFAEGMFLSQCPECSGGKASFLEAQKLISLNPSIQDNNGKENHMIYR